MEEISSSTVAVPIALGKLTQESSVATTHIEISGLKLMANTAATLILNPENNQKGLSSLKNQITTVSAGKKENRVIGNETSNQKMKEHGFQSSTFSTFKVEEDEILLKPVKKMDTEIYEGFESKPSSDSVVAISEEKLSRRAYQNGLEMMNSGALWGYSSICGKRDEMEDAISAEPQFLQVPSQMLMENHETEIPKYSEAHFFGVYDGHGGCQVANYCRERLHSVLIEEIEEASRTSLAENWRDQWKKALCKSFLRVDDEVDGKSEANDNNNEEEEEENKNQESESESEPLAPETVGSTAVVAILSETHIIVANCGDSRAVLCRGKEAIPLSVDHKPNREDEWARIEAAGGRVIQWNGYRVLGVLAVSRSIGDRYLKPWTIPEPEIEFIVREKKDECLILASDGLWDVMTNEEACQAARSRILLWHKKYGNGINDKNSNSSSNNNNGSEVEEGLDPAAQFAAEYLSRLALQRGSKDNISVIVVDLKAQRKSKTRA